jgi:N-acetylmuramoyl-L-alanine amidase
MTDIAGERARLAAQGLHIITREQWGARQNYTSDRTVNRPAQWLFLHITVTDDPADTPDAEAKACRVVEDIGQERFGIGWSYNAGVMQSGRLYEGQPLTRRGAHTVNDKPNPSFPTGSLNYDARALALVQDVQDAVTDAQIDSAARWGAALRRSGEAIAKADWFGHRDVAAKSCPGDKAYVRLVELNALTDYYTEYGLGGVTTQEDEYVPMPVIAVPNDTEGRATFMVLDRANKELIRLPAEPDGWGLTGEQRYQAGVAAGLYQTVRNVDVNTYDRAAIECTRTGDPS